MKKLRFRGLAIEKQDFEEKYNLTLTDIEWQSIVSNAERNWEEDIEQIRLLASKYIRDSLMNIGYKPTLDQNQLHFKKVKD